MNRAVARKKVFLLLTTLDSFLFDDVINEMLLLCAPPAIENAATGLVGREKGMKRTPDDFDRTIDEAKIYSHPSAFDFSMLGNLELRFPPAPPPLTSQTLRQTRFLLSHERRSFSLKGVMYSACKIVRWWRFDRKDE